MCTKNRNSYKFCHCVKEIQLFYDFCYFYGNCLNFSGNFKTISWKHRTNILESIGDSWSSLNKCYSGRLMTPDCLLNIFAKVAVTKWRLTRYLVKHLLSFIVSNSRKSYSLKPYRGSGVSRNNSSLGTLWFEQAHVEAYAKSKQELYNICCLDNH